MRRGLDYAFVNRMKKRDTDVAIYLLEDSGVKPSEAARLILEGMDELRNSGGTPAERFQILKHCLREGLKAHRESGSDTSFGEAVRLTLEGKAGQSPRTVQDFRQCMNRLMGSVDGLRDMRLGQMDTRQCTEILETASPAPRGGTRRARACLCSFKRVCGRAGARTIR